MSAPVEPSYDPPPYHSGVNWPRVSFEDRMDAVEFRVGTRAHITVDGDSCRGLHHQGVRHRVPGQPVRARPATAASCSTTSSASSAAPATWSATPRAPSSGPIPTAATASCSTGADVSDLLIGVALKWVDLRPEVDPLTGQMVDDGRSHGCSAADQAALEWALRLAAAWDAELVVATVGPAEAEALLREALAHGATRAVRVAPSEGDHPPTATRSPCCWPTRWSGRTSCAAATTASTVDRVGAGLPGRPPRRGQALGLVQLDIGRTRIAAPCDPAARPGTTRGAGRVGAGGAVGRGQLGRAAPGRAGRRARGPRPPDRGASGAAASTSALSGRAAGPVPAHGPRPSPPPRRISTSATASSPSPALWSTAHRRGPCTPTPPRPPT